jgi:hypothetical protein
MVSRSISLQNFVKIPVAGSGEVEIAVGGGKKPHRGIGGMVVAFLRRHLLVHGPARGLKIQQRDAGLDQGSLHPAAFTRDFAIEQRDQDALRQEGARHDVGDGDADADRALARNSRHRHDATHALRDLVDRGPRGIGAVLAEAGNAAIDDARIAPMDGSEIDAEPLGDAGPHVFDHYVGLFREPHQDLAAFVGFQVQRDGALVAMQVLEVRTVAPADQLAGLGVFRRRLDPDHVGAPIGQRADAGGACAGKRQVDHLEPRQWQARGFGSLIGGAGGFDGLMHA